MGAVAISRTLRDAGVAYRCTGYGFTNEYEVARLWRDSRVRRLGAGTIEIMRDLRGRAMAY